MRILGINNYYQPKYTNIKHQKRANNISQLQTKPDSFSFQGRYMHKVNGFTPLSSFTNIKHPDNRAFYDKLKQKFKNSLDVMAAGRQPRSSAGCCQNVPEKHEKELRFPSTEDFNRGKLSRLRRHPRIYHR